ncbi:ATP-dependent DNA ligase [Phytoactinopolyspora halotolerans]|uniref:ATP-dependent DNA ligase n=1 Tax=Phytoactinopolyspora halotolerans TaxID=1981512 RepID=A0A6L9S971_9ACTN|nr:ATP-dependent DNA ligase [Phytoactinopolyspora halotolerans]
MQDSFPEIATAVGKAFAPLTVLDGEIVRWSEGGRLDFGALQRRHRARGAEARRRAGQEPCHYIVFDLLQQGGDDLRPRRLDERGGRLEQLVIAGTTDASRVVLGMQSGDVEDARVWMDALAGVGVEGVVAKRLDGRYEPGRRSWLKVKQYATTEFVIGGVTGRRAASGASDTWPVLFCDWRVGDRRAHGTAQRARRGAGGLSDHAGRRGSSVACATSTRVEYAGSHPVLQSRTERGGGSAGGHRDARHTLASRCAVPAPARRFDPGRRPVRPRS